MRRYRAARADIPEGILAARTMLLTHGHPPQGVLPAPIERSWSRCLDSGLAVELSPQLEPLGQEALRALKEQNARLLSQAMPEIESLRSQLAGTQSMVMLTDAGGTILHALGDADFISKAQRVALQPGVSWREENTGTNAIGTSLVERQPVFVAGAQHYFEQNAFLNCSAAPIFNPQGAVAGVLDVSGDYRQPQAHTLALVRMSAQMIENRLFRDEFCGQLVMHFHARPEFIGTLWEGMLAINPDGRLLALNQGACALLGVAPMEAARLEFSQLFEGSLPAFIGASRQALPRSTPLKSAAGQPFYARLDAGLLVRPAAPAQKAGRPEGAPARDALDQLDTGDSRMRAVIEQARRVMGRDIPILIEGATGTGKELVARAIHAAAGRKGAFVAINCAAIPEGLVEAELFGYEEGAFTGARRHGAAGKIVQASGGTLFLDEIGDMPPLLQARLLRVLQEREVVPLGGSRGVVVDIAVISATNRNLRDAIAAGQFRQDLYYRLAGLRLALPGLAQRSDFDTLAALILREEHGCPVAVDAEVGQLLRRHVWPGNLRELRNVLRTALAFLDDDDRIRVAHLPAGFVEECSPANAEGAVRTETGGGLAAAEAELIRAALRQHGGNVTRAARQLGVGRATLYRKLKRLRLS